MEQAYSVFIRTSVNEAKEAIKSTLMEQGFEIITEKDLNEDQGNPGGCYQILFDCNHLFSDEFQKGGLIPNFPYCNVMVCTASPMKTRIYVLAPDASMTEYQKKRFAGIIPLLNNNLARTLNTLIEINS